jgi:hypothetical protein
MKPSLAVCRSRPIGDLLAAKLINTGAHNEQSAHVLKDDMNLDAFLGLSFQKPI